MFKNIVIFAEYLYKNILAKCVVKNGIQIQSYNHIVHINNICRNIAKLCKKPS